MTIQLFPHQHKGIEFLTRGQGTKGLFFGMGTGKTLTAIYACNALEAHAVLIIAPPIALPMWQEEYERHAKGKAQILKTGTTKIDRTAEALIVSYAIAQKRAEELRDWAPVVLICDESHALKSPEAKRTKAVLGSGGIASGARHTWLLTGTPITRWNDDVYPFLCRADLDGMKEYLGGTSLDKFQLKYCVRQKRQFSYMRNGRRMTFEKGMTVGNKNTEDLAEWIYTDDNGRGAPLALRVDLKEVFESMPPLTHRRYEIPLSADAQLTAALKELEKSSMADLQRKLENKEPALATIRRQLGLAKVKAAADEIGSRIESGQNVLIGAWHTDVIDELASELARGGATVGIIDGRATAQRKKDLQDQWNAGQVDALVCQIAAAGVSLNLQHGGTQIVVVEEDWSPSIMDQFYARLWRYGQEKHVHVDTLVSKSKLDAALGRISKTKAREHEKFNAVGREN